MRMCSKEVSGFCNLSGDHPGPCAIRPSESKRRRFVQIAAVPVATASFTVFALDDAGEVWGMYKGDKEWTRLPALQGGR